MAGARGKGFNRLIVAASLPLVISLAAEWSCAEQQAPGSGDADRKDAAKEAGKAKKVYISRLGEIGWYPADAKGLKGMISGFFGKGVAQPQMDVRALILPHAGYRFSGKTGADAVVRIQGLIFSRVIVIGPSHRVPLSGANLPVQTHYATPLGEIALDTQFISALLKKPGFKSLPESFAGEHSVEISLPILQEALGEFKLVPIVVGDMPPERARAAARSLLELMDAQTLVIASSDFMHYGPSYGFTPFKDDIEKNINDWDMKAWGLIEKVDLAGFDAYYRKTGITICGHSAISVLLAMLPAGAKPTLIHYTSSGKLGNDWTNSVSYLSATIDVSWNLGDRKTASAQPEKRTANTTAAPEDNTAQAAAMLTDDDKKLLLKLARMSLLARLRDDMPLNSPEEAGVKVTPGMKEIMGAFVTLRVHGELRGCIGEIFPSRPLFMAVMERAVDSGLHDSRFTPVKSTEMDNIVFEISALMKPRPVASWGEIEVGKHGIVLTKAGRSALFLPQVAVEQKWDLAVTLSHLSAKAGLPRDAWKEGASFQVFEAIVFGEDR